MSPTCSRRGRAGDDEDQLEAEEKGEEEEEMGSMDAHLESVKSFRLLHSDSFSVILTKLSREGGLETVDCRKLSSLRAGVS